MDLSLPLTHLILLQEPWESKYDFVWGLDSDVDLTGIRGDLVVGATCWGPILPCGFWRPERHESHQALSNGPRIGSSDCWTYLYRSRQEGDIFFRIYFWAAGDFFFGYVGVVV